MFPVAEQSDGPISAKIWEVRTIIDGELVCYHEVYFKFGSTSPILRLHESDLSSLQAVLSRLTDEIDRRNETAESDQVLFA